MNIRSRRKLIFNMILRSRTKKAVNSRSEAIKRLIATRLKVYNPYNHSSLFLSSEISTGLNQDIRSRCRKKDGG